MADVLDVGVLAQKRAEKHLAACMEALDDDEIGSPASAPFCGCNTCVIREVLWAVWPLLVEEAEQ